MSDTGNVASISDCFLASTSGRFGRPAVILIAVLVQKCIWLSGWLGLSAVKYFTLFVVSQEVIRLGGEVELAELGPQHGVDIQLPPVLLGILGKDPAKKTVSLMSARLHNWTPSGVILKKSVLFQWIGGATHGSSVPVLNSVFFLHETTS